MNTLTLEPPRISLAEKLSTEIERVREIRTDYQLAEIESLLDGVFVLFYPQIEDAALRLQEAEQALKSESEYRQIRAHVRLKEIVR